jgi:hypothetical protein
MRHLFLPILCLLSLTTVVGQTTEYAVSLNSGLFSFGGPSAEATSSINYDDRSQSGYTNNPYGSRNGLCAGLSGSVKRVGRAGFIVGVDLGYDLLRSRVRLDAVNGFTGKATYSYPATGDTYLNYSFLNAYPFVGYRLRLRTLSFDLTGGIDAAYCLKAVEAGAATATNDTRYTTSRDRRTLDYDARYRFQLLVSRKRLGVYAGYSRSPFNYKAGYVGGVNECYARLIRFGLTYRLRN